ncbi:hypothetical protein RND81_05G250400 [Saponaria officinalis]|uniref:Uncharacterized protein n=1 Tax=Saponaria officinalis TaxID=3572 RepID=A0AAW1L257_SAPOF
MKEFVSTIYANEAPKPLAYRSIIQRSATFSFPMKRLVRLHIVVLLFIVVAATFGSWVSIRNAFGSVYVDGSVETRLWADGSEENPSLDFVLCNSTLLKLAEIDAGEAQLREEIEQLLDGSLSNPTRFRTFVTWLRLVYVSDIRGRISKEFKSALSDWSRKKRFQPDIMEELLNQVKVPIDVHNSDLMGSKRKYSSCAVVGNSGILLNKEFGELIDGHEAVIRLKNARIKSFEKNVGSKTSMSFMNSNTLHRCATKDGCFCHPYGANVPIIVYMTRPVHFLDYVVCNSSHKSPLIMTDPRLDLLCSRIVKYYSMKRFADGGPNKTYEQWYSAHDGAFFHYSSGIEAVTLALGICDRVSLFGFGKSNGTKHHYHTNQKQELSMHDYQAEYDFYHDLVKKPHAVPFFSESFKFPPVVIHR